MGDSKKLPKTQKMRGTVMLNNCPAVLTTGTAVGIKEKNGKLGKYFDWYDEDATFGEDSWEKSESYLQKTAIDCALNKVGGMPFTRDDIDMVFAGDLQSQCTASGYSLRDSGIPYIGLYGACSTMAESIAMAACMIDGGYADTAAAVTSSHFCSAGREFRFPLMYGEQRAPTSQWTATAAGCAILSSDSAICPAAAHSAKIGSVTFGKIKDMDIKNAANMGAAMAAAAFETIDTHLKNTNTKPGDYDILLTGDLGEVGSALLKKLFTAETGVDISGIYNDCGLMLYDSDENEDSGGSGCGCSAAVLCGYILPEIARGNLKNVLFTATGALLSPVSAQQGESIPGIAHAVHFFD